MIYDPVIRIVVVSYRSYVQVVMDILC